jgi:hypothetical protein
LVEHIFHRPLPINVSMSMVAWLQSSAGILTI